MAWNFGVGPEYCRNCKLNCHTCEKNKQPQTVEGQQAWEIIKSLYYQTGDNFPLLEALELARLSDLELPLAKEYFLAASKGYKIAQYETHKSQS